MTKKQKAKIVARYQCEEQLAEAVSWAEDKIFASILNPEAYWTEEERPIIERARDTVRQAVHELADLIIVAEQKQSEADQQEVRTAFEGMTEQEHEAMKTKLLMMANAGQFWPAPGTLEGYCLAAYTDDGIAVVPAGVA